MRKLILIALLAVPAFPSACTLTNNAGSACASKSCTMSAIVADTSHANWSGVGCTANGYVPAAGASAGTGDTVTIPGGYALTVNQNWAIGANNANNGTAAITAGITAGNGAGQVFVNSGVTLTLRGDFVENGWLSPWPLTMNAGSALVIDSSLSASPSATRYRIGDSQFVSSGVSASHVTVTSCAAGNTTYCASPSTPGLPAQFSNAPVGSYPAANQGAAFNSTYTDFSYMGDATTYGWFDEEMENVSDSTNFQHNTLNYTGPWYAAATNYGPNTVVNISFNTWTNSPQALTIPNLGIGFDTFTSGSRTITNNVFDTCAQMLYASSVTWSNNFLGASDCAGAITTAQTWNFVNQVMSPGSYAGLSVPAAGLANGYYLLDFASPDNPHWTGYPSSSATLTGYIYDDPDDFITDSGEMWTEVSGGSTETFNNSIELPTKTGNEHSELMAVTSTLPAGGTVMNMYHNTWGWGRRFRNGRHRRRRRKRGSH